MLETADMKRIRQRVDAVRATAGATWYYRHSDIVLRVDLFVNDLDVQLLWHLESLGDCYHLLRDGPAHLHGNPGIAPQQWESAQYSCVSRSCCNCHCLASTSQVTLPGPR